MQLSQDDIQDMLDTINQVIKQVLFEQIQKLEGKPVTPDDVKRFVVTKTTKEHGKDRTCYRWRNRKVISLFDPSVREEGVWLFCGSS